MCSTAQPQQKHAGAAQQCHFQALEVEDVLCHSVAIFCTLNCMSFYSLPWFLRMFLQSPPLIFLQHSSQPVQINYAVVAKRLLVFSQNFSDCTWHRSIMKPITKTLQCVYNTKCSALSFSNLKFCYGQNHLLCRAHNLLSVCLKS